MAGKGWTARVATAAGAAAGTGAAQLGLGYGLGVIVWPVTPTPDDSVWLGSLGWATWIAASATVIGAVISSRVHGVRGKRLGGAWRFALAASAAIGALVAVALIALPARSAVRSDTFSPQVIAAGYAVLGIVLGLLVAYWAVVSRPVAANLIGTAVWLWALAITAIVVELTVHRDSATYLTSWQFAEAAGGDRYGTIYWPSALLTLVAAFLLGVVAAAPSAVRGELGTGAATSGAVGPLVVAASFLALAPRLTGALDPLESAYLIAPYAVLAGLAGSALTVATGRSVSDRRARKASRPPKATGVAAVPAADLDTPPSPPQPPKTKSPAAVPAQPTPNRPAIQAPAAPSTGTVAKPAEPTGRGPSVELEITAPSTKSATRRNGSPTSDKSADARGNSHAAAGAVAEGKAANATADAEIAAAARPRPARPRKAAPQAASPQAASPQSAAAPTPAPRASAPQNPEPRTAAPRASAPRTATPEPGAQSAEPQPAGPQPANPRSTGAKAAAPKAAGAKATGPKSTITPPPNNPTIAQINPKAEG